MIIHRILSRNNPKIKSLLKDRDRFFIFEGEKLTRDLISRHISIQLLVIAEKDEPKWHLSDPQYSDILETWFVSSQVMAKLSTLKESPSVFAVTALSGAVIDFSHCRLVIGLDSLQDPANAGSIFRCAAAFNVDAIALCGSSVKPNNSKLVRAAQDALFTIPYQYFPTLDSLTQKAEKGGLNIYLTSSHLPPFAIAPDKVQLPALIIIGNEGQGVDKNLFDRFPAVFIPQSNQVESLNAGISACILMYCLRKTGDSLT